MKVTLTNDFHNTSVNLVVTEKTRMGWYKLSKSQWYRANNALCGMAECKCGGTRGSDYDLYLDYGDWGAEYYLIEKEW